MQTSLYIMQHHLQWTLAFTLRALSLLPSTYFWCTNLLLCWMTRQVTIWRPWHQPHHINLCHEVGGWKEWQGPKRKMPEFTEGGAAYIERGLHLEYNESCPNVRNIRLGLWWHNTPPSCQLTLPLLWHLWTRHQGLSKIYLGPPPRPGNQRLIREKSTSTNSDLKKRLSSPRDSAQPEDCIKLPHAKTITLNTSALSNPDSLTLSLTSDTLPNTVLKSLVDSGSSDSFIDSVFIQTQHLPAYGIPPIKLRLIDGTSNSVISQALDLQNLLFY